MFGEIELAAFNGDGRSSADSPGVTALYSSFNRAVEAQGIRTNGVSQIDQWIEAVGGFQQPVHSQQLFPIGGHWLSPSQSRLKDVGRMMLQNLQRLGASMKPLLLHSGIGENEANLLVENHVRDLHNHSICLYHKYHTVYATRE